MATKRSRKRNFIVFLIIITMCAIAVIDNTYGLNIKTKLVDIMFSPAKVVKYNEFLVKVEKKEVTKLKIDFQSARFQFIDTKGKRYSTDNPKTANFKEYLLKNNINVTEEVSGNFFKWFMILFMISCAIGIFIAIRTLLSSTQTKIGSRVVREHFSEIARVPNIKLNDIAGNKNIKKDLQFIIDFLKNPERFREIGARLPKGIIFYGEPGTGKTLTAKAIAGEAGVPFFSVGGSDFVEMYVGVGAKRVRELFAQARKKAPCIIFIDELDAVGKKRTMDSNGEKDQTINAILAEMDGFNTQEGIIVIGATNRLEILDSALIRPGRFDKHIRIPLPEYSERLDILKIHTSKKKMSETINLEIIAKMTIGFSGAGLETLLNESALIAISKEKTIINNEDVDDAFFKMIMGGDKSDNKDRDKEQLKIVAWHEAGHALVAKLLTKKSVPKVTIIPTTTGAGGVTFIIPDKAGLHTKRDLINDVKVSYAGRVAEFLLSNDNDLITTGASQDIKQATSNIMSMIKDYGMTVEFGMLSVDELSKDAETNVVKIAKDMSKEIYEETLCLLKNNYKLLQELANKLLEKETLEESDIDAILFNNEKVA